MLALTDCPSAYFQTLSAKIYSLCIQPIIVILPLKATGKYRFLLNTLVAVIYIEVGSVLVKPVPSAIALMPMSAYELPYERAKEMLLVDDVNNKEFLCSLFLSMYEELPVPKEKNYRKKTAKKPLAMSFYPQLMALNILLHNHLSIIL